MRVFEYNNGTWTQIGQDINGQAVEQFGWRLGLNSSGSTLVVGAPNASPNGANSGLVRVYRYVEGAWNQIGSDIEVDASDDKFGSSVDISAKGTIIAVGAPFKDGDGTDENNLGLVRVFYNDNGTWTQVGQDITGEANEDRAGSGLALSGDKSVVAVGSIYCDETASNAGEVRVFENDFTQIPVLADYGVKIYPNPSSGNFFIRGADDFEIKITDVAGRVVYGSKGKSELFVHLAAPGLYVVNFKSDKNSFSSKILIKK